MKMIPVPLDWLQRVSKVLDDVRVTRDAGESIAFTLALDAANLNCELAIIVADAQKEEKP